RGAARRGERLRRPASDRGSRGARPATRATHDRRRRAGAPACPSARGANAATSRSWSRSIRVRSWQPPQDAVSAPRVPAHGLRDPDGHASARHTEYVVLRIHVLTTPASPRSVCFCTCAQRPAVTVVVGAFAVYLLLASAVLDNKEKSECRTRPRKRID